MAEPVEQRDGNRFDIFSDESRQVLFRSDQEAHRFNHNYIGTEHILLGLVSGPVDDLAVRVLSNLGTDLNKIRSEVEFIIGRGERNPSQDIGLTPRAQKVLQLAQEEHLRDKATEITTMHLLRGLVREGEGIAAGILESTGIGLDRVRAEIRRIELEQKQKEAEAMEAEKSTPEEETVQKLQSVLENPKTPDRTKSFIMDLVNRVTSFAEGEIDQ